MAKFNTVDKRRNGVTSAVTTAPVVTGTTYQGAPGYTRDAKSELFLLAVNNMVGEETFYEKPGDRDTRFEDLVTMVAVEDPQWMAGFIPWLRNEANMRSASLVAAAHAVPGWLAAGIPGSRKLIDSAMSRADEPGEFLAYWISRFGDKLPKPVKRGVADAAARLYNEYTLLKYDTESKGLRFSNVIQLTHPTPKAFYQRDLFKFAMDRVYQSNVEIPASLKMVTNQAAWRKLVSEDRLNWPIWLAQPNVSETLREAGLTREDLIPRVPAQFKRQAWEAIVGSMGYMALLRNLRNFDEAGVGSHIVDYVSQRLGDPNQVAKSRQFPFRFLSAYRAAKSLNWGRPLEAALEASLANVPALPGKTLVLVDRSGSMFMQMSDKSEVTRAEQAAIFGTALALRNLGRVDLVQFGYSAHRVDVRAGDSLLRVANERFSNLGGTYLAQATRQFFAGHDRVIVITDEQYHDGAAGSVIPASVPVYTFNLAGYKPAGDRSGSGNRHTFGGLTDAAFKVIPLLEAGASQSWPWESE